MSAITQQKRRRHTKTLAGILVCLAVWFVLYHSLAGGTLLAHNVYDSYALQAKNWLNGSVSIAGGERYTWLELATYHGKYYLSFPPVPAVLQLPWVMALGENTPSNLITAIYALFAAAGVYFVLAKSGKSPQTCACWTLLATLGSNFTVITASGGVWLQAQILNLCFAVWGLYFYLADQKCAAFALLALAVGCRPFSVVLAAILFLPEIRACAKSGKRGQLLKMAALPLLIAALLCGYNYVRFGNPLEFGHNYLPEFLNSPKGQFSLSYLPTNLLRLLRPVTLSPNLQLQFPLFDGFLFFLANPIFAVWFVLIAKCAVRRRMGG